MIKMITKLVKMKVVNVLEGSCMSSKKRLVSIRIFRTINI